uniref:Heat shock protein 90 n=1 Tax=Olive leaf mottling virus TaxID=3162628 RepID=A0AAU7YRB6_9CLOS
MLARMTALPPYKTTFQSGDIFRSFYGVRNIQRLLDEGKSLFQNRRRDVFIEYWDNSYNSYDVLSLLNSRYTPFILRSSLQEYAYFYMYEDKYQNIKNLVYPLVSTTRGILLEQHLDDLDIHLNDLPDDVKYHNVDFSIQTLLNQRYYQSLSPDRKQFLRNICICCNRVVDLEKETLSGSTVFQGLPVVEHDNLVSIGKILEWSFLRGRSVIRGLTTTKYYDTGDWFKNTLRRLTIVTGGVGVVDVVRDIWCISFLGGIFSIADHYDLDSIVSTDSRSDFFTSDPVSSFLSIFMKPRVVVRSKIHSTLRDFLPLKVTNLSNLRNNPTLVDYLRIDGKAYPRLTYLDKDTIISITQNLTKLLRKVPYSSGTHALIKNTESAFDNNNETFVIVSAYYGVHGTCSNRVERRPDFFRITYKSVDTLFLFKYIEDYFDDINRKYKFSVRRAYLGTLIYYVDMVYVYADLKFRSRWIHSSTYHDVSILFTDLQKYRNNLREDETGLGFQTLPSNLKVYSNESIHFER